MMDPLDPPELLTCEKVSQTEVQDKTQNPCTDTEIPDHLKDLYLRSSQNLSPEDKSSFKQLLIKYQDTFSRSSHDLGRTTLVEYHINIIPGTKPIKQPPYRLPLAKRREAEKEIQMMADRDLIEFQDVHSPDKLSDHDIVSGTLKIFIPPIKKPRRKVYLYQKGD